MNCSVNRKRNVSLNRKLNTVPRLNEKEHFWGEKENCRQIRLWEQ